MDEIVNDSPIDSFRRQSKPRVLTESHFESIHAPKRKLIDPVHAFTEAPTATPALEELFRVADSTVAAPETSSSLPPALPETTNDISEDVADTTFKTNPLDSSSEATRSNEITREFTKSLPATTPKSDNRRNQNGARRNNARPRTNSEVAVEEPVSQASRSRSRRPTRRPEEASSQGTQEAAASRPVARSSRRRPESSTQLAEASRKGPSIFIAQETQEVTRVRPGQHFKL